MAFSWLWLLFLAVVWPAYINSEAAVLPSSVISNEKCEQNCLEPLLVQKTLKNGCPNLQQTILLNYLPNGNRSSIAGISRNVTSIDDINDCVSLCCEVETCHFAILRGNASCQLFFCTSVDACMPQEIGTAEQNDDIKLVLVRPPLKNARPNSTCETGVDGGICNDNEECLSIIKHSRNGVCGCKLKPYPFLFTGSWTCEKVPSVEELERSRENATAIPSASSSSIPPSPPKPLEVSVVSKNISLPVNEVQLFGFVAPQSKSGSYEYNWKLISHPDEDDTAVIEGQTTETLHLTRLIQGIYIFQVTVTSKADNATGSANATVMVFPPKRTNQPPVAVISPAEQTIQLPTNSAVLDAQSSTDDTDKILSYKWDLQKGPIDFDFSSTSAQNSPTLQINNLVPGNFTFKLTVSDSDLATGSATANVTVLRATDYPPTANAGKDIVIYLPQSSVTLNGNLSTDDKKIELWEWKATGDIKKAVDMQDSHTSSLKVSGLEEGLYTFQLQVTDSSGQVSSPSTVHIFVKRPTGKPPQADAGANQTIALPQTWAVLDSSGSSADSKIIKFQWIQLSGPNNLSMSESNTAKYNVTGLRKGDYEFIVKIEDDTKLIGNATTFVKVVQKTNEAPKAKAGEDLRLTLPQSLVEFDGSKSKDDVGIVTWKWEREPSSLSAGVILGDSDKTSKLKLTNLIPGKYEWRLHVVDEQGLSSEDTVSLLVLEDPLKKNLIQVDVGVKLPHFTESDKEKFLQELGLLVRDTRLIFHHISQYDSEFATIYLYGLNTKNETREALSLAKELRAKILKDAGLLEFPVDSVDTLLCLNRCSGHGLCQDFPNRRECVCDAFWMENFIKRRWGSGEKNCDWSKIYVGVILCFMVILKSSIIWSLIYLFRRRNSRIIHGSLKGTDAALLTGGSLRNGSKRNHNGSYKNKQYTLLDDIDEDLEMEIRADEPESDDSDSDESLIFERGKDSSSKNPSASLIKNIANPTASSSSNGGFLPRNGILKKPRPGIKA